MKKLLTSLATASLLFAPSAQAFEAYRTDYEIEGRQQYSIHHVLDIGNQQYVFVESHFNSDGSERWSQTFRYECNGSKSVSWDSAGNYGYSFSENKKYADDFCELYSS